MSLRRKKTTPFYQQPWFGPAMRWGAVALLFLVLHLAWPTWSREDWPWLLPWLVDALGAGMVFLLSAALLSQFILPVSTPDERWKAFEHFFLYITGRHGPIIFVRNGERVESQSDVQRIGKGVVLCDAASAVVLERRQKFSRAVGPGITFTEVNEKVKEALDLRPQVRVVTTKGLTRDSIEIEAEIAVYFRLAGGGSTMPVLPVGEDESLPARAKLAYYFDPQAAFRAVYNAAYDDKGKAIRWWDMPAIVVAELFRDYVAKNTLDRLFERGAPLVHPQATMAEQLLQRVKDSRVLSRSGVEVEQLHIRRLELPNPVQAQLAETWKAVWQNQTNTRALKNKLLIERRLEEAQVRAETLVIRELEQTLEAVRQVLRIEQDGAIAALALRASHEDAKTSADEMASNLIEVLSSAAADRMAGLFVSDEIVAHFKNVSDWKNSRRGQNSGNLTGPTAPSSGPTAPSSGPTAPSSGPAPRDFGDVPNWTPDEDQDDDSDDLPGQAGVP